jgi:hypothetical protein
LTFFFAPLAVNVGNNYTNGQELEENGNKHHFGKRSSTSHLGKSRLSAMHQNILQLPFNIISANSRINSIFCDWIYFISPLTICPGLQFALKNSIAKKIKKLHTCASSCKEPPSHL